MKRALYDFDQLPRPSPPSPYKVYCGNVYPDPPHRCRFNRGGGREGGKLIIFFFLPWPHFGVRWIFRPLLTTVLSIALLII